MTEARGGLMPPGLQWVHDELVNWARWGREHAGPGEIPEPSIWNAWLSWNGHVAGWGLTQAQQEAEARGETVVVDEAPPPAPVDEALAEHTDATMAKLMDSDPRTYVALREHYYRWRKIPEMELHTAMRHYADLQHVE